jgi:dipeptidyl aminopeptidase/acylaminoacyl peptidase
VTTQADPLQATTRTVNVELILDASGSMAETLPGGETRMEAAKRILREIITGLPERPGVNVGLRVYGHQGDNTEASKAISCRASELLVPVSGLDKAALIAQVEAIQPTGWTPITYSLQQAAGDFQPGGESITNAIVLVTDGEETCDPPEQSCDAAAAAHQADISVITHVVGFALNPQQTELVRCVAEEGGGQLFGADNATELSTALTTALGDVGVPVTPIPVAPVPAAVPLADIGTLAYHQLTAWSTTSLPGYIPDYLEQVPILSDDGERIAFGVHPGEGAADPRNRIYVLNADGTGQREVDAYPFFCFCGSMIDLNADGSRVLSSDAVQLRIADGNGGGGRELIALDSNELNAMRISSDGSTIVFRIYRDTTIRNTSPSQPIQRGIYRINPDGTDLRQLVGPDEMAALLGVAADEAPFFGGTSGLDISANGAQIVFTSFSADRDSATGTAREGLFAVNGDGSDLRRLLGPTFTHVNANAISGDGATVAYVTNDFGTGLQEAGVLAFDGSGQRILTDSTSLHPGTGANLPSGERIQLSTDGSRLLLGSTGLLVDTTSGDRLALGVSTVSVAGDPHPLVVDGLYRPTMNAQATRVAYLFQPPGEPYQIARIDLNPDDLGGAPSVTEARVSPGYILTEGRSTATVSAQVTTLNTFLRVGSRVLYRSLPDPNVDTSYYGAMVDDGASLGDATAGDDVFTYNGIVTNCCAEVGPRTVRIKAETQAADGLRHATAVDVVPFQVSTEPVEGGPPSASTPRALPSSPEVPLPSETLVVEPATPSASEAGPATGTGPATATAGMESAGAVDVMTPDPAECTIAPRTAEELAALAASPDQAATDAVAAASLDPALSIPEEAPADAATTAAVTATYQQMIACFNAGNDLAAYALWTDDALRQFPVEPPHGPPTALPEGARSAFRVREVRMLPDGRVVAVWEQRDPALTTTLVQVLVRQDTHYLVAETLDAVFG